MLQVSACNYSTHSDSNSQGTDNTDQPKGLENYYNGETLFQKHCATCHGRPTQRIEGPSIFDRLFDRLPDPSEDYFRKFVMDGSALIQSGDSYLLKLESAYQISCRHDYRNKLTQTDFEEILLYLKVLNRSKQPGLAH